MPRRLAGRGAFHVIVECITELSAVDRQKERPIMRELFPVDSESTETSLVLRTEDGANITKDHILALAN